MATEQSTEQTIEVDGKFYARDVHDDIYVFDDETDCWKKKRGKQVRLHRLFQKAGMAHYRIAKEDQCEVPKRKRKAKKKKPKRKPVKKRSVPSLCKIKTTLPKKARWEFKTTLYRSKPIVLPGTTLERPTSELIFKFGKGLPAPIANFLEVSKALYLNPELYQGDTESDLGRLWARVPSDASPRQQARLFNILRFAAFCEHYASTTFINWGTVVLHVFDTMMAQLEQAGVGG